MANIKKHLPIKAFAPVVGHAPRVLILGTMPSVRSLDQQQYYAHPRNAFWPLMCSLLQESPMDYQQRCQMLKDHHIALWDVLQSCVRPGSADSAIRQEQPNDFECFFKQHPSIHTVCFNGQGAQRLWKRHVTVDHPLQTHCLAATSPAYTLAFEQKLAVWQRLLDYLYLPIDPK